MSQPKDKDWLNGYKNRIPIYVVHKRPISKQGTHTDLKWRVGQDIPSKESPKESRSKILITDKIDCKINAVKRDKEAHYIMIQGSI